MYLLPFLDGGNGPKTSTVTLSNAFTTGIGSNGAHLESLGDFLIEQSWHDLHHCSTS